MTTNILTVSHKQHFDTRFSVFDERATQEQRKLGDCRGSEEKYQALYQLKANNDQTEAFVHKVCGLIEQDPAFGFDALMETPALKERIIERLSPSTRAKILCGCFWHNYYPLASILKSYPLTPDTPFARQLGPQGDFTAIKWLFDNNLIDWNNLGMRIGTLFNALYSENMELIQYIVDRTPVEDFKINGETIIELAFTGMNSRKAGVNFIAFLKMLSQKTGKPYTELVAYVKDKHPKHVNQQIYFEFEWE